MDVSIRWVSFERGLELLQRGHLFQGESPLLHCKRVFICPKTYKINYTCFKYNYRKSQRERQQRKQQKPSTSILPCVPGTSSQDPKLAVAFHLAPARALKTTRRIAAAAPAVLWNESTGGLEAFYTWGEGLVPLGLTYVQLPQVSGLQMSGMQYKTQQCRDEPWVPPTTPLYTTPPRFPLIGLHWLQLSLNQRGTKGG